MNGSNNHAQLRDASATAKAITHLQYLNHGNNKIGLVTANFIYPLLWLIA